MRKFTVILSAAIVALTTAVTMSPAQATSYKVTASISTVSAQSGDGPYMRGTLKPAHSGKSVNLQWYDGANWHTGKTVTTDGDGAFKGRVIDAGSLPKLGSTKFRAKLASGNTGTSSTVTKTIYAWLHLAYLAAYSGPSYQFIDGERELTVDTNYYADEGWLSDEEGYGSTKWNLQEKCIKFKAFAGLDDYLSTTGAVGKVYVGQDGTKYDYSKTLQQYQVKVFDTLNLHLTKYLSITSKRINLDENTVVGVGEPRVLCKKYLPETDPFA